MLNERLDYVHNILLLPRIYTNRQKHILEKKRI